MSDQYIFWRKALELGAGRELSRDHLEQLGNTLEPQSGFWRRRAHKDGPFVAIAIWRDETGKLWCLQNGEPKDCDDQMWSYCCKWPITEELYHSVTAGGAWPEEPPTRQDNMPAKTGDAAIDLQAEFEAEKEQATEFLKKPVTTQQQADQIAVWAKKIAGIVSNADDSFDIEKKPWREGAKKVDDRWRWRQDAEALVKSLKKANEAWLKKLDDLEQERQRKAREEAEKIKLAAEQAAREAEQARQRAIEAAASTSLAVDSAADATRAQSSVAADFAARAEQEADQLAKQAQEAAKEAEARPVFAGRTGAKTSLHTFYVAEITDYDALLQALKDEPEVREVVEKIANRIARTAGVPVPAGMKRKEDKRAA